MEVYDVEILLYACISFFFFLSLLLCAFNLIFVQWM